MDTIEHMKDLAAIKPATGDVAGPGAETSSAETNSDQVVANSDRRHFLKVSTVLAGTLTVGLSVPIVHRRAMADTAAAEPGLIGVC